MPSFLKHAWLIALSLSGCTSKITPEVRIGDAVPVVVVPAAPEASHVAHADGQSERPRIQFRPIRRSVLLQSGPDQDVAFTEESLAGANVHFTEGSFDGAMQFTAETSGFGLQAFDPRLGISADKDLAREIQVRLPPSVYSDMFAKYKNDSNNVITVANTTSSTCTWTGVTSTSWTTTSNWTGCANGRNNYPDMNDWVIIPSGPTNQPTVSAPQKVRGFAAGAGGGTITLSSSLGVHDSSGTVQSSVNLKGATSTTGSGYNFHVSYLLTVNNGATLTLDKGTMVVFRHSSSMSRLLVGDGISAGHLVTTGGSTSTEWPTLVGFMAGYVFGGITVQGVDGGQHSSVSIDGLMLDYTPWSSHVSGAKPALALLDYYDVFGIDNLEIQHSSTTAGTKGIQFQNCANSSIVDTAWSNLAFADAFNGTTTFNVDTSGCSVVGPIDLSGSGVGYGSSYDSDSGGILNWL